MRRQSRKKPVLTSPWKIGTLVALLLVAISAGAVFYMVRVYGVELHWLKFEGGRWQFNSFIFFKEMYILAAAVIAISIFGYFLVVSAVRRYRFYLDSGQDYRTMISLAESIDDLTNPAQIARLSHYPELQTVLRNYGDQIREVSQELEQRQQEHRSVDLEIEIESLLRGEPVEDTLVEGKWWAPLFKKLAKYTTDNQQVITEIEGRIEQIRRIFCSVVLSNGKVVEAVTGAGEDLADIVQAAGELNSVANGLNEGGRDDSTACPESGSDGLDVAVARIENSLRGLGESSRELNEFSEENNGLALSIALMAAKGGASDRDLTQFAEKARGTAERFKRLGAGIMGITEDVTVGCRALRQGFPSGGSRGGANPELRHHLSEIASQIEERCTSLQQRITKLKNELEDTDELLQRGLSKLDAADTVTAQTEGMGTDDEAREHGDASIVNFGAGSDDISEKESDLVIEHGSLWEDESFSEEREDSKVVLDGEVETGEPASDEQMVVTCAEDDGVDQTGDEGGERAAHVTEEEEVRAEGEARGILEDETEAGGTATGDGWMKMPGHRWFKVDVERSEREQTVDVEVKEKRNAPEPVREHEEPSVADENTVDLRDSLNAKGTEKCMDDEEPVYDLFELGAVEYVEERQHR